MQSLHEGRIRIHDDDPERGRWIASVLTSMDLQADLAALAELPEPELPEPELPEPELLADPPLLVIIGEPGHGGADRIAAVAAAYPATPLCLVGERAELPAQFPAGLASRVLGVLEHPVRFTDLGRLLQQARRQRSGVRVAAAPDRSATVLAEKLIGTSAAIRSVRGFVERVAPSDSTILITGETGSGKEVVARALHALSDRADGPFVAVNCGAIPFELLESELFGHEKGSFTGAVSARKGRFELAEGGTLFLDEIGDMPAMMQVKLLRVLQERTYERIGGHRTCRADVRVVTATHRDLEQLISEGRFREDLYYRLNVFPIEMPALRERHGDLRLLIKDLLGRFPEPERVHFTAQAMQVLELHLWPGNVRELSNVLERLCVLNPGALVDVHDLPSRILARVGIPDDRSAREAGQYGLLDAMESPVLSVTSLPGVEADGEVGLPPDGVDLKALVVDLEKSYIRQALEQAGGVVAHAASILSMRRTTLVEKMRKYELQAS